MTDAIAELIRLKNDALAEVVALRADVNRLRNIINREQGEPIEEAYTSEGVAIISDGIRDLQQERDDLRTRLEKLTSDAAVEAAARALYEEERNESMGFDAWPEYDHPDNAGRSIYEDHARAALTAAVATLSTEGGE